MTKTIKSVGEFGLISEIKKFFPKSKKVLLGIGDDAALVQPSKTKLQLLTVDTMVEDVDFDLKKASAELIGRKALGINISDIAAMAGKPKIAVVSLVLPGKTNLQWVKGFCRGIAQLAMRYGVSIVGGDLSSGPKIICSLTLLGEVAAGRVMSRNGAEAGDVVAVTGTLGGSILSKHLTFAPRVEEGEFLSDCGISSMIDISDGLVQDLYHLIEGKRLGFKLNESMIPISEDARKLAKGDSKGALYHALYDGEDFELLFTVKANKWDLLVRKWRRRFKKTPLTAIGSIVRTKRIWGMPKERVGFRHF